MNIDQVQPQALRRMSERDFALWGVQDVAYVGQLVVDNQMVWAICAADGNRLGVAPDREVAFAAVRQHDLEPLSVH